MEHPMRATIEERLDFVLDRLSAWHDSARCAENQAAPGTCVIELQNTQANLSCLMRNLREAREILNA